MFSRLKGRASAPGSNYYQQCLVRPGQLPLSVWNRIKEFVRNKNGFREPRCRESSRDSMHQPKADQRDVISGLKITIFWYTQNSAHFFSIRSPDSVQTRIISCFHTIFRPAWRVKVSQKGPRRVIPEDCSLYFFTDSKTFRFQNFFFYRWHSLWWK